MIAAPARPRRLALRRPRVRTLLIAVPVIAILLGCGWLWLRDSSLVSIRRVSVTGLTGPDQAQIREAIVTTARRMTTLDLDVGRLEAAVAGYPQVRSLRVRTQLPHGVAIHVVEQVPVAVANVGGRTLFVDTDGQLLAHAPIDPGALPSIADLQSSAAGGVTGTSALEDLQALAAAPYALLPHIASASTSAGEGIVIQLRNGPALYLGAPAALPAKWAAAIAVLDSSTSAGAGYIDVSDPRRPAAGA